jgi:hypothetical protein
MKIGGGDYDDGEVFIANWLVHVIPAIIAFIFLTINWTDIADSFVVTFGFFDLIDVSTHELTAPVYIKVDRSIVYIYTLSQYLISSLIFMLYMLVIDLHEQYEISKSLSTWVPILGVLVLNLFSVCAPILFMFFSTISGRFVNYQVVYDCIDNGKCSIDGLRMSTNNWRRDHITIVADGVPRLYVKDMANLKMYPV